MYSASQYYVLHNSYMPSSTIIYLHIVTRDSLINHWGEQKEKECTITAFFIVAYLITFRGTFGCLCVMCV